MAFNSTPSVVKSRKSYLIRFKSKNYESNCDECVSLSSFLENLIENALIRIEEILSQYRGSLCTWPTLQELSFGEWGLE